LSSNRIEPLASPAPGEPPARKTLRHPPLVREVWKKPALRSLLLALLRARLVRPESERCAVDIECYPGIPYHRHALWKVARYAGAKLVRYRGDEPDRHGRRPKLRLFWPDTTAVPEGARQGTAPPAWWWQQALNGRIGGDSKRRVEELFAQTFGYSLAVDPRTHDPS
jgi:hypothetical protein